MGDISKFVEQQDQLIKERDELVESNKDNFEYVSSIKQQSGLRKNKLVLFILIALAVSIIASVAVYKLIEKASPMLMWLTVGIPLIESIVFTLLEIGRSEKLSNIYRELNRDLSSVETRIYLLNRDIKALQARIDEVKAEA